MQELLLKEMDEGSNGIDEDLQEGQEMKEGEDQKDQKKQKKTLGEKLKAFCKKKFPRLFREKVGFPPKRKWVHEIDTGDAKPIRAQGRPLGLHLLF